MSTTQQIKVPTLELRLSRPLTYPECTYTKPATVGQKGSSNEVDSAAKAMREWNAWIRSITTAKDVFKKLKKGYESKTTTEFYALLSSLIEYPYNNHKHAIKEHITQYERTWNMFIEIISRAELTNDDGFEADLQNFTKSDRAKAEFLLRFMPPFYANTGKNIQSKDGYKYDDIIRKLKEYILQQQKNKHKVEGTKDDPVVLNTKSSNSKDKSKTYKYCKEVKGWKGIGHIEEECFMKKREEKRTKKAQVKVEDLEPEGVFIQQIRVRTIDNTLKK